MFHGCSYSHSAGKYGNCKGRNLYPFIRRGFHGRDHRRFFHGCLSRYQCELFGICQEISGMAKSKVKPLFADGSYMAYWDSDLSYGNQLSADAPVTAISWFAAKKYCECQGKRLPTIDEWEFAAMADEKMADARKKESYNQKILDWYEAPKTFNNDIGSTFKNYWDIYDLHGLVWEWTMDFNSVLISGESRKDVDKDSNLFCGSAAVGASDMMNYAAFMRYAFRGSMKAKYSVKNLGFRCEMDVPKI